MSIKRSRQILLVAVTLFSSLTVVATATQADAATRVVRDDAVLVRIPGGVEPWDPNSDLVAVSCGAVGYCMSVGSFRRADGTDHAMIRVMVAGVWMRAQQMQIDVAGTPDYASSQLNSVSCADAGECVAVGSYFDSESKPHPMAVVMADGVIYSGQRIGIEDTFPSSGYTFGELSEVSCPEVDTCVAVGYRATSDAFGKALAVRYEDGYWDYGIEPLSGYTSGNFSSYSALSCSSSGNCAAAGVFQLESGSLFVGVSEMRDGAWRELEAINFPAELNALDMQMNLQSISCGSDGDCVAGGSYLTASTGVRAFLTSTSLGHGWSDAQDIDLTDTKTNIGGMGRVESVSCVGAGECVVVGFYENSSGVSVGFAQQMSAGQWGAISYTEGTFGAGLVDVSCISVGNCTAVGFDRTSEIDVSTISRTLKNGIWASSKLVQFRPSDINAELTFALPSAVTCVTSTYCVLTGQALDKLGAYRAYTQLTHPSAIKPGKPGRLSATPGRSGLTIYWSAPADNGGATVVAYRVQISTDGRKWKFVKKRTSSSAEQIDVVKLNPDTTYYFRIAAINSAGAGSYSSPLTVRTLK